MRFHFNRLGVMSKRRYIISALALIIALSVAMPAAGATSPTKLIKQALGLSKKADKRSKQALKIAKKGGPQGQQGQQGNPGEKGDHGDTGAQGQQGVQGDQGDTGATGAQGTKGDTGATGAAGAAGAAGPGGLLFTSGGSNIGGGTYLSTTGLQASNAEGLAQQILATSQTAVATSCAITKANGAQRVFTLRLNGADSSLTCTIPQGAVKGSGTGSVSLSAGDLVDVKAPATMDSGTAGSVAVKTQ